MNLRQKFIVSFCVVLGLVLSGFWYLSNQLLEQAVSEQRTLLARSMARQTADSVTELVLANDLLGLNVVLGQLAQEPGFVSATIVDVDKRVLASTLPPGTRPPDNSSLITAPITLQDSVAGEVILEFDDSLAAEPRQRLLKYYGGALAAGLLAALVLTWHLGGHIARRLLLLLSQTEDVQMGNESAVITVDGNDEIGRVQQKIADLLDRTLELEDQVAITGAPDQDALEAQLQRPERRMATLLVVEVVNSAAAVELLHPAALSTLLQQYQFYLRQASRLYRGVVSQLTGDRAVVAFDVRLCQDEHAFNAICCGQLFLQLMQRLAQQQRGRTAQSLEFHLAVHSGDVFFSAPWKSTKHEKDVIKPETLIGNTVALAQELLAHAETGRILASELSYDLASGELRFALDPGATVQTDKRSIMTFSLPADCGAHHELLERQCQHLLPEPGSAQDPIPTLT